MLIGNVRIDGSDRPVDVRCEQGVIVEVSPVESRRGAPDIDGAGAALLPGLHDHHIHLYALAAQRESVQCGPPHVATAVDLARALRDDPGAGWLRGVGYHESVAGPLDRWQLDRIVSHRPVKVQHRSGKLWIVNSLAARLLSLDDHAGLTGVELDAGGRPDGRLLRLDDWMRGQLDPSSQRALPSLAKVSRLLAGYGVTGVTDTTPDNDAAAMANFVRAAKTGELLQQVRLMGGADLPDSNCAPVQRGERKIMLDEHALPSWDELRDLFTSARDQGRAVAVHCVTPAELVLALSVLREVGPLPGDRIEHASLVPADTLPLLRGTGVRVVTQPGFIRERGDQYRAEVDAAQHADLYRCRVLLANGIPLGGSTDAPFGEPDPWAAMRAAVRRESRAGHTIGPGERLSPEQALALFTCAAEAPGGQNRRVAPGEPADLCLLDRPWAQARGRLSSADVRMTLRAGKVIYHRDKETAKENRDAVVAA